MNMPNPPNPEIYIEPRRMKVACKVTELHVRASVVHGEIGGKLGSSS